MLIKNGGESHRCLPPRIQYISKERNSLSCKRIRSAIGNSQASFTVYPTLASINQVTLMFYHPRWKMSKVKKRERYFLLSKNASHYFQSNHFHANYLLVLLSLFHVTANELPISSPVFIIHRRGDRRSGHWDLLAQREAGSCSATIRKGWARGDQLALPSN